MYTYYVEFKHKAGGNTMATTMQFSSPVSASTIIDEFHRKNSYARGGYVDHIIRILDEQTKKYIYG